MEREGLEAWSSQNFNLPQNRYNHTRLPLNCPGQRLRSPLIVTMGIKTHALCSLSFLTNIFSISYQKITFFYY